MQHGAGSFDYDISDGNGGIDSASVTVDVTCVNDAPVAVDDTASGTEDMPVTIDPADLVADDTDVDGDSLSVTGVSNAAGGLVALDGGTITFTPDANLCASVTAGFDYAISDGNGGTDTGHVAVDLDLRQRRTGGRRRHGLGHRGHAGHDRSGRPGRRRHRHRWRHA